jgi:hypothetical protein
MQKITIQKEHTATRCEICHKDDLFDGFTSTCQRCKDLSLTKQGQVIDGKKETTAKGQVPVFVSYNLSEIIACVSMIVGTILFVFFPELIVSLRLKCWNKRKKGDKEKQESER